MIVAGASEPGRVRPNNEDCYVILVPPDVVDGLDTALLVADGMGGHAAGEVASGLIATTFRDHLAAGGLLTAADHADWASILENVVGTANRRVFRASAHNPDLAGMGSTVVAALVRGNRAYLASVGDSRAYLLSDSVISQLTRDHSWVAEQVRAGALSPEEALRHPYRHILTRAVGGWEEIAVDLETVELMPGDYLLLCSDGVTNVVADRELAGLVTQNPEPAAATQRIIELANRRGAPDNVTVVIARYTA